MRINTKQNKIDLTSAERSVLVKADALTALIAKHSDASPAGCAELAYTFADAMLAARGY